MKKSLLTLAIAFLFGLSYVHAQYYYNYFDEGQNPKYLNKDEESPYPNQPAGWSAIWSGDASATTSYSALQNIPFAFKFNGNDVTKYSVGNFGVVTFSDTVPTTKPSSFSNLTLPNANIADNSVCILGIKPQSSGSFKSAALSKTFGTAPNRQHWIWFNFYGEPNLVSGWTFWAIVLEETTNNIYIVDMRTLCVNNGYKCTNNTKLSAGIQINNSTAYTISGSPNLGAKHTDDNISTEKDNSFYMFVHGTQPENSARVKNVIFNPYNPFSFAPFTIKSTIQNLGSSNITNVEASYRINGGSWVTSTVNTPSITPNSYQTISHPTQWTPSAPGIYTIDFQVKKPDGGIDPVEDDDIASITIEVVDTFVNRRILIESFTSSTCGPCNAGNRQITSITSQFPEDRYIFLKYQYSFPGTGDPYFTSENGSRGGYYGGVNSIPATMIDGNPRFNPGGATMPLIQNYMGVPSFVNIDANAYMVWKDNFNFDVKVTPFIELPAGIKLHVAIVEKITYKNVKTNGETEFHNVLKKFAYGPNGKVLPAIAKGTEHSEHGNYQFHGDYRLPANAQTGNIINWNTEHSIENFWNLGIVVFLQNDKTKEVLQAQFTPVNMRTSVNQNELQQALIIYPNPADDMISINFNKANNAEIIIRNIQGQVVKADNFNFNAGSSSYVYDTKELANGVYTITLNSEGSSVTQKIIVNH